MTPQEIREELFRLRDEKYKSFQGALIPTVPEERMIGVRTPALRALAKRVAREDASAFLAALPHEYFDEDQLHAFVISEIKDFDLCLAEVGRFLPYIDNWATCDQLSPPVFRKEKEKLLPFIRACLSSGKTYSVRFGIKLLMDHFLNKEFDPRYLEEVAAISSDEYYVKMMIAWYFATALAKRYEETLPYLEEKKLSPWVHNMTIRKAKESFRISTERKDYLKSLAFPYARA